MVWTAITSVDDVIDEEKHGKTIEVLVVEALDGLLTKDHVARHTMLQVNTALRT